MLVPYNVLVERYNDLESVIAALRVEAKGLRYGNAACAICRKLPVSPGDDDELAALDDPPFGEYGYPRVL